MPTVFATQEALRAAAGTDLGVTDWLPITQERINQFADATGDHQWIHVDPERAKSGPFGTTIAHGYLTLALSNLFLPQLVEVQGMKLGVNYGCDKIRFPAPVKVNARVRGRGEIKDVSEVKGGLQATILITIEIEGEDRPACVIESLSRYFY
ncbi:MAG: MaoC family dehydratase [Sandaracinaceae bacterium]|nr:MaoC family dehydratase [Sandaracinaceae bacterium]